MFRSIGLPELIVIAVLFLGLSVFTVVPFCRITERTGYSRLVGPAEFAAVRHAHLGMFCGFLEMAARHSRPLDRA